LFAWPLTHAVSVSPKIAWIEYPA